MMHAFFGSLPMRTTFRHKGKVYSKVGEERAREINTGNESVFEIHYGCFVDVSLKGIVDERPL